MLFRSAFCQMTTSLADSSSALYVHPKSMILVDLIRATASIIHRNSNQNEKPLKDFLEKLLKCQKAVVFSTRKWIDCKIRPPRKILRSLLTFSINFCPCTNEAIRSRLAGGNHQSFFLPLLTLSSNPEA